MDPTQRNLRIGRAIEEIIAGLLAAGHRHPGVAALLDAAAEHPVGREGRASHRAANRQRIFAGLLSFFAFHLPPDDWQFIASRVRFSDGEFDLVWRRPDGMIVVDEVKSGRLPRPVFVSELKDQIERELAGGRELYPGRFAGVRLLWLANPRHSFFAPAVGGGAR